ncbi:2-octaprenyl-6-methoxyphenyl hydroxylase [Oceanisphaera psychrotolerans]|uniref:2-octaprenyl-6-methoxyphenyl hydroxylase n=1 Tax=Oceanisphaera psychrotolerans TaxID=1414654 RepID=A0A1J4QFA6_9GAMM|nr:2-octaprenyl-6-methoxyphenyl hydroxylase [Oceanisphaera psychrotolerans]OIN12459.1 2-octaprenyl-6-methoxyphenyl hydroxylase [Oceanisphaera psychrotolerans]
MTHYDVVINGGGMAGAVLALGLSRLRRADGSALRIAVIEAVAPDADTHPGFDARSIALAGHSRELLEQLGLWSQLAGLTTPITHIQVSDQGHLGQVNISADDYPVPALGYVVELHPLGQLLYRHLQQSDTIELLCPARIQTLMQQNEHVMLTLNSGRQLTATLLVAADGNRSVVRQQLGLPSRRLDYRQSAIIANVQGAQPHGGRAFERFTREGPIALLPMGEGRCSLVWCASTERAEQLMTMDDDAFLRQLQQEFGYRLGRLQRTGRRHCYPLTLDELERPWHHRVVLIGNAAHLLHPIAGQGFNLGLRDVAALVESVGQALKAEQDIGSYPVLSGYGQARQPDQAAIVGLTTALALLFSNDNPALAVGRNLGLMAMAASGTFKDKLAWRAMGKR